MTLARISSCGKYRYTLSRIISPNPRCAIFIMLNPSTADAMKDDPTIRKCMGFAERLGCGTIKVLNLFAYRATSPKDMRAAPDPVGRENKYWVDSVIENTDDSIIICSWGAHGGFMEQDETMLGWLIDRELWCLGKTKDGHPRHPLMVSYSTQLEPFDGGGKRERMKEADCPPSPEGQKMIDKLFSELSLSNVEQSK